MSARPALFDRPPVVETSNFEVAQNLYASLNSPIVIERRRSASPFGWRAHVVLLGRFDVSVHQYGGAFEASGDAYGDVYSYSLPLAHTRSGAGVGDTSIALEPGRRGSFVSPGMPGTLFAGDGHRSLQVKLPGEEVASAFATLTGETKPRRIVFAPELFLDAGAGASLHGLSLFLADEAGREDGALTHPAVTARLADALISTLLLGLDHDSRESLETPAKDAEPVHVRLAAEYLAAHARGPVRMAELSAITGMTLRSIQSAFRRYRGCSPTEFLLERRLLAVRAALLAAPHLPITRIALDHGFAHLGRFSARYRARFGETPSRTRARVS